MNKKIVIYGGGTFNHVACHLAIAAPAFGSTARRLFELVNQKWNLPHHIIDVDLKLTKMADPTSPIITNRDLGEDVKRIVADPLTKVVFFNAAVADFEGQVNVQADISEAPYNQDKYGFRFSSRSDAVSLKLHPAEKLVQTIRKDRKDIFLVAFKTTCWKVAPDQPKDAADKVIAAHKRSMYLAGLNLCKQASVNLVLVNNVHPSFRYNMIVTPEEAAYHETDNREDALENLVDMAWKRSHLTFTRSTVVAGDPVPWDSPLVPDNLRTIVNYCVEKNAYKPFHNATVGHFACKIDDQTFLTSIRKSNFNELDKNGLVLVKTDGPDTVIAYGAKPSVGGQSQRTVFNDHPGFDCIVHFHCPLRPFHPDNIPIRSQRDVECGSHQCGKNTSDGLATFIGSGYSFSPAEPHAKYIKAVYLDQHGPNIVFSKETDPQFVIDFIERNFDLEKKTGGYQL